MRNILSSFALCFIPACLMAVPIKGVVKDATTGEELPGVTIIMKEEPVKGTATALDGSFKIDVPTNVKTLVISCIGYKKTEYAIDNNKASPVVILLEPERLEIGEVTVYGYSVNDTEKSARTAEKTSMNVMNVMAAKTIELSPDMTVANVLQRVSGISLEKTSQGEGKYPIIRGMDKRYSYTLVNSVKIPSPNDKNRYVPMDLFPAELLEKLEVTKALTPDMESDAIGGAMNLVMKNAPGKFFVNANISTGYGMSSVRNDFRSFNTGAIMDLSPAQQYGADYLATPGDFTFKTFNYNDRRPLPDFSAGVSVGDRFFGHKLGIVASVSYQNNRRFNQSTFFEPYVVPTVRNNAVTNPPVILPFKYVWQNNRDGDRSVMLNLAYVPDAWLSKASELKAGALYRIKHRNSYYNSYNLYPKLIYGAPQIFEGVDKAEMYFTPAEAGYGNEINPNHYISDENIIAAYIQAKIRLWNRVQILTGVRIEKTKQQFETSMPEKFEGKRGKINYTDFSPSFHLKYEIDKKQNLRFSYYKAICRPGFFEVIPYFIIGEDYKEGGNPYLKRTRANNFDIRYEYFPTGIDQLLLGIFYKDIKDPIEHGYSLESSLGAVLRPNNFGEAYNYGAEVVLTKYIGNFGLSLNYTFTRSRITTDKGYYGDNGKGEILTVTMPQTRPLQGQSMHVANVSLLYKNPELGLDLQLSSVYTGKRILQLSPYYGLDYWQQPAVTLDFSTEKNLLNNFSIFMKLNNLLDIPVKVLIEKKNDMQSRIPLQKHPDYYLVQNDRFGQSGLIGLRYKLK